jgi:hypothetical protein
MPRTLLYVTYADESGTQATIVHVFPDADAMDSHFQGSEERSRVAYGFIEPDGWEIYGIPSASALTMMQAEAASSHVSLSVQPTYIGGFLRLEAARD